MELKAIEDIMVPFTKVFTLKEDSPLETKHSAASFLMETGLRVGDMMTQLNSQQATPSLLYSLYTSAPDAAVDVKVKRTPTWFGQEEELDLELTAAQVAQAATAFDLSSPPTILGITEEMSKRTGLQRKDVILEVDGAPASAPLLDKLEQSRAGGTVSFTVKRPAILLGLIQEEETLTAAVPVAQVSAIGVLWGAKTVFYRVPATRVLPAAFHEGIQALTRVLRTLWLLLTGVVAPQDLGEGGQVVRQAGAGVGSIEPDRRRFVTQGGLRGE